jgi:hypothetical protein
VHRIDVSPAWSRDLLPIGMFGPFLFYRLAPRQSLADDWLSALSPSHQEIAVFDGGLHSDGHLPLRADRAFDLHSLRGSRLT